MPPVGILLGHMFVPANLDTLGMEKSALVTNNLCNTIVLVENV